MSALPIRFALFDKGGDAFRRVGQGQIFHHHRAGVHIGLFQGHLALRKKPGLAHAHYSGAFGGDGLGQCHGFLGQRIGCADAVDKPKRLRAVCINEFARGQHFERGLARDIAGQRDHGGGTEQADVHAVHAKPCARGGNGKITGGHQLAPGGGGDTVHLGNHGLGQGGDGQHQPRAAIKQIGKGRGTPILCGAGGLNFTQVMARAKGFASTGQDDHADGGIGGDGGKFSRQPVQHGEGQGVQFGRITQGDMGHMASIVTQGKVGSAVLHLVIPCGHGKLRVMQAIGEDIVLKMDCAALNAFLMQDFPELQDELVVDRADDAGVALRLMTGSRHLRPGGTVSGPTLFMLADVAVYLAILSQIGPVALTVTTSASIDFMRKPAAGVGLVAQARILKLGRALAVGDVLIHADGGSAPVARASLTYAIPPDSLR